MSGSGGFSIAAGTQLGDLLLVRELGRGNQGMVYEALQVSLGRKVAVKILPRELGGDGEQLDRFHREAEAAGRLTHPNIVAVYGFDDAHGHPLIVQELVTGGSLEKVLAERAARREGTNVASCRWAAETCRSLAEALEHAHRHNVIHRDIKPGNVLLTEDGVPKLADFGLAKVSDLMDLSHTGTVMGTPHYMSPEQVSAAKAGLDARTDVYSLGAVLYRMLTLEVPFAADNLQRMFNDILTREPRPPRRLQPGVHPDIEAVCLKALEKSPEARYGTAAAMAEDLARFLRDEPTLARPVGVVGRTLRLLGRQSNVALVVLSLLVPTAWFAGDVLLRRDALRAPGLHDLRVGVAALAALLLAWPLSHLGLRLARGRAFGAAAAVGCALLLGATAAFTAHEQKLTQLHHGARAELAGRLDRERVGTRPDTADLEAYAARWESRFDDEDQLLLARGYLKRERPVQAQAWAARLRSGAGGGAVQLALRAAIAAALGQGAEAASAEAALREAQASEQDWRVWERIGDILVDMHRDAEARASYERAARLPGADRDLLNVELAQVSAGLCEWERAADVLEDVMKWRPDDPVALQLAISIAERAGDWQAAERHVASYVANPGLGPVERLDARFGLLIAAGRREEAEDLLAATRANDGSDPLVREWCARTAIQRGKDRNQLAGSAQAAGDATAAAAHAGRAVGLFEAARDDYAALTQRPGDSLIGRVGLAAALLRLAPYHAAQADELYAEAAANARRAIELDPYYYQAHYNLGIALETRALRAAGGQEEAVPLEAWRDAAAALQGSAHVNGLQANVLNDCAHVLYRLHALQPDATPLDEARDYARRAIALAEAAASGACHPDTSQRLYASSCWDTLSEIEDLDGNLAGALDAARSSLDVLNESDTSARAKRAARIARLEQAAAEVR
jgi:Tfp pilus assembly protein PilF